VCQCLVCALAAQVEAAVLLHAIVADPRNFGLVLDTFETDSDRDNVCHR
jgi:hypothetical protein